MLAMCEIPDSNYQISASPDNWILHPIQDDIYAPSSCQGNICGEVVITN